MVVYFELTISTSPASAPGSLQFCVRMHPLCVCVCGRQASKHGEQVREEGEQQRKYWAQPSPSRQGTLAASAQQHAWGHALLEQQRLPPTPLLLPPL